jgi:hypothetical protein
MEMSCFSWYGKILWQNFTEISLLLVVMEPRKLPIFLFLEQT